MIHLQGSLPAKKGVAQVVLVVPPPPQSPRGSATGSSPSGGLRKTYEVVVRISGGEGEPVTLRNGDILRLDEDEEIEATGGGIAFILLKYDVKYDVVPESHDH